MGISRDATLARRCAHPILAPLPLCLRPSSISIRTVTSVVPDPVAQNPVGIIGEETFHPPPAVISPPERGAPCQFPYPTFATYPREGNHPPSTNGGSPFADLRTNGEH